ncbi:MAG: putative PEP-binding protein [Lentisphaeria bacterium]
MQNPLDLKCLNTVYPDNIGLFRTEYLYLNEEVIPNEEEQFLVYKQIAMSCFTPITVRTFDLGGDKFNKLITVKEANPFLGTRGARLSLKLEELFNTQLRAILRASAYGKLRILIPMITTVEEIIEIKELINKIKNDLTLAKVSFDSNIQIGIMLEVPAAVLIADVLANYVDFFSIGTNDLCQYIMGVDRSNTKMDHLYQPSHPAMIRLIKNLSKICFEKKIKVSICGEIAGDVDYLPLLLGCGLRSFSMNAMNIVAVNDSLSLLCIDECEKLVDEACHYDSSYKVLEASRQLLKNKRQK